MRKFYSFCVKNKLTVTIPGQSLNVEAGNKRREKKIRKESKAGLRFEEIVQDGYKFV